MQKLTSLSTSQTINLFDKNENLFPMDYTDLITLDCECSTGGMGSFINFCFEINSSLLNENKDAPAGKIFQWTFQIAGVNWSLGIFPSGINPENRGYTSIFLHRKFVRGLIDKKKISAYFSLDYNSDSVYKYTFTNGRACGLYKWRENKYSKISGRFVMMCSFEGFNQTLSNNLDTICFKDTKPRNTDVLFTKRFDIELKGDGWTYYFYSELLSTKSNCVTLQNDSSKTQEVQMINVPTISSSLMKRIFLFLINGNFQLEIGSIEEVCKAAECLGLTDLKLACEFMLLSSHSIKNNDLKVLTIAYDYDLKIIKYECLYNTVINFNSVCVLPDWEIIRKNNPNILLDIIKHIALTTCFTNKPDDRFSSYKVEINSVLSPILSCSKAVLNAYDVSNQRLSAVIAKLTFEIPLDKLKEIHVYSFQAEETKWSLLVFPNKVFKDYVSICLCYGSTGEASVDFVLDCDQDIAYFRTFSGEEKWGFPNWKLTADLKSGLLTVNFAMRQRKQASKQTENGEKTNSVYRFSRPLDEILNLNFMKSDILLIGDGWEYNVHRELLTGQSPVFDAMFSHDTKENKEKTINITDIGSDTMKQILTFLYTGKIEIRDETVTDICAAADKYLLDLIKLACEHVLCNSVTIENVADRYIYAEMYNLPILKSTSLHFITKNFEAVTHTEGWVHLTNQTALTEKILLFISKFMQITRI